MTQNAKYLTSQLMRERFNVSNMTLWRWENNAALGFPKPIRINKTKYWLLDDLIEWETAQIVAA